MKYSYRGSDAQGRPVAGEVDAAGLVEAAHRIAADGVEVVSLLATEERRPEPALTDVDAFVFFNRALAEMTRAGLPLPVAVGAIARSTARGPMQEALGRVETALREGKSLEACLDAERAIFPAPYRMLVRAGAAAGNLPAVLSAAATHASVMLALRRGIGSAMVYPLLALATCWGVAAFLAVMIMPYYRALYIGFRQRAPSWMGPAETLLRTPVGVLAVLAFVTVVIAGVLAIVRRTGRGEALMWRVPLLGTIARGMCMARLFGSLRVMLAARMPLGAALPAALVACGSVRWSRAAETVGALMRDGAGIGDALARLSDWPVRTARSLAAAEKRGRLEDTVRDGAERASEHVAERTEALVAASEPAALAMIGVLVGLMMLAIVAPYFQLLTRVSA